MSKPLKLKEMPWGLDHDETCIYISGHLDKAEFLQAVRTFTSSDLPKDVRETLIIDNVEHCHFRRMSPSEARAWGCDWGWMKEPGGKFKMTAVFIK